MIVFFIFSVLYFCEQFSVRSGAVYHHLTKSEPQRKIEIREYLPPLLDCCEARTLNDIIAALFFSCDLKKEKS